MISPRPRLDHAALLGASCLALLVAGAARAQTAPVVLDTVTVEGEADGAAAGGGGEGSAGEGQNSGLTTQGYVARSARVGTKTDTPLRKVPQSISVVSNEEMERRNVQTLVEAVQYRSGVRTGAFGYDPRFDSINIRGFDVTTNGGLYRDGLRDITGGFSYFRNEPYGIQGITILKGPSSALYGSGAPGGLVNYITKRPTDAPFREVEAQIGNHDRYQINFDASGPLGNTDNVLYRLTGIARSADTEFISARDDRRMIAPALTFRTDDRDTQLTILGEFTDFTTGGAAGYLTLPGNRITDLLAGDPAWRDYDQQQGRIGYEFEHRFNDALTVRQNLRYADVDADIKYTEYVIDFTTGEATGDRQAYHMRSDLQSIAVDNQAEARFDTGPVAHTLLGGVDYNYSDVNFQYGSGPAPGIDLDDPDYGSGNFVDPGTTNLYNVTTRLGQTGVYLQDQAEYRNVVLTLGGRYDWVETETVNLRDGSLNGTQDDEKFTWRAGLSYLFDNGITPYVSYSTSFAPLVGTAADGTPFRPTEGEQAEVGVKYAPDDLNLTVNAALFHIRQKNVLATIPTGGNPNAQFQRGEVVSQGFEIEAVTSLMEGWNLSASYTYLDLELREGVNDGNVPAGIPAHQFAVWSDYTVQSGVAAGLGFGAGVRFQGENWIDDGNVFGKNGERAFVDAMLSYDFGKADPKLDGVLAQVNARNLFDDRPALCNNGYCYRDQGRTVIGSLRYRF